METINDEMKFADMLFGGEPADELGELRLSPKTHKFLLKAGITTIDELLDLEVDEFKSIPNISKPMIREIVNKINRYMRVDGVDSYPDGAIIINRKYKKSI